MDHETAFKSFEKMYMHTIDGIILVKEGNPDFDSSSALIGILKAAETLCIENGFTLEQIVSCIRIGDSELKKENVKEKRSSFKVIKGGKL